MAYDPAALDFALAAAVGDDPALQAELRGAFFAAAEGYIARMETAADDTAWHDAARRLHSLAAGFGAVRIADAAAGVAATRATDTNAVARLRRAMVAIRHDRFG